MGKTAVIFSTSDIQRREPLYLGQKPVFDGAVDIGTGDMSVRLYSTGRLEQAIASGADVYICSLKPWLGPHDAWWRAMVPEDRVFHYHEPNTTGVPAAKLGTLSYLPWQRLFARLGIPWVQEYERVTNARAALKPLGYMTSEDFPLMQGSC